jgi:RHS repeat-associated protein
VPVIRSGGRGGKQFPRRTSRACAVGSHACTDLFRKPCRGLFPSHPLAAQPHRKNARACYAYGPFGEVIRATGPMAKANPCRFSSKYQDDETDLLYYGYRYYNSSTGRWLARDPMGEGGAKNLYAVGGNDYVDGVDRIGLDILKWPVLPPIEIPWPVSPDPWPSPSPRPKPPIFVPVLPTIRLPEDPISCGLRIKNEVWYKYGWDSSGNPLPDHKTNDLHFHYGHCVAHCRIQRECIGGRCTSWIGGIAKEIEDEIEKLWSGKGDGFDMGDLDANREGRKRGRHMKNLSCDDACKGTEG